MAWSGPMQIPFNTAPPAGMSFLPLVCPESGLTLLTCTFLSQGSPDDAPPVVMHADAHPHIRVTMPTHVDILADPAMPVFQGMPYDTVVVEYTHSGQ